ncbi:enoyl-CoA hydratase [Undibacterium sp. CY18W]|uniref:Enoyl-CoA hydratase domain-containing protein 3, mitochondrial n=1 Tax=Undibacterium hunanense TaxID=2762292 RepID=A0ABR6ZRJ4_9BURK|nr:enoyl-CoA hydratase [Undibacterium hunanense]MBC3918158.1 enoyl-CoA hydratase [Undibacterium hunanense]
MSLTADTPWVLRNDADGVTTLTLNRGERFNPLSEEMLAALLAEFKAIAIDETVRVVVLAATGKAFCAGHDLKQMQAQPSEEYYKALFQQCSKLMLAIQKLPQPVIARVQGLATAAGCQLVGMCDLAVASDNASFAVSGVNVGLFCSTPAVALSRNVSRKQAMEMLLTGDFIDAQTAWQRGLINHVVSPEQLDACVAGLAASIIAKPALAIRMGKQLFYKQLEMGMAAAYQLAGQTMACNMMDDTAQEGVQAFLEKRSPVWK